MSAKYWDITRTAFRGCRHVSAGCDHCWAERFAWRLANNPNPRVSRQYSGLVTATGWTGKTRYNLYWTLDLPNKGKKILFNCMGDLFHEANKPEDIQDCLDKMQEYSKHTFIVPTKRPAVAFYHLKTFNRHIENMVLLASVEDQATADERLPWALRCHDHVKLVGASVEPLLGPVDLSEYIEHPLYGEPREDILKWIIIGPETGPGARPNSPQNYWNWYWGITRLCVANNLPLFEKCGGVNSKQEIPL